MRFEMVDCDNEDLIDLCHKLEDFQYDLMPVLMEQGYNLTEDLDEVEGFVLYDENKPIGSIGLRKVSEDTCEIVRVFVDESQRGKGLSKLLFNKIVDYAKSKGFKKAEMVAWEKAEAAIALYKKLGFNCSEPLVSEWFGGLKYFEFFKEL